MCKNVYLPYKGLTIEQRPVQQSEHLLLNGSVRHSSEAITCEQSRALASAEQASGDMLLCVCIAKAHDFYPLCFQN
jgi:hypothetical protein